MRSALAGFVLGSVILGCGTSATVLPGATSATTKNEPASAQGAKVAGPAEGVATNAEPGAKEHTGPWIGAAGASDFVLPGTRDSELGVWIDVPTTTKNARVPAAVAIVMDTSGSMGGSKIEHARHAARSFVERLPDGDIVNVTSFADSAVEVVSPTVLNPGTRPSVFQSITQLQPTGGTNMFEGLKIGGGRVIMAPGTHPIRRVILISDGQANVGPSSPDILAALAQKAADRGVQVTSLGVGTDYDERTLNAIAMASSGRLYHMTEASEMASIMDSELKLLQQTAATDVSVEIVPAPNVQLVGVDGVRADWSGGSVRIPLGTMFGGQHREMLVRVRINAPNEGTHALASVRLHFRDPAEGNLERVQEVVARFQVTGDPMMVAQHQNARTQTIAAVMDAGKAAVDAAQQVNAGDFDGAEQKLAVAEAKLREQATKTSSAQEKQRAVTAANNIAKARKTTKDAAAKPAAARRPAALEVNSAGMDAYGY